jgi:YidC/Oxa1 family membrane protein insertase
MILAFSLADIVQVPFGWLMAQLYSFTSNYGVALIIFAILVKLILLPATAKGKKSSMKMSRLSPRLKAIQAKYADDQQKQSEAMQALYKEEGVSMGGGCLWSLLPLLILFPLYTVVRQPIVYMLGETAEAAGKIVEVIKAGAAQGTFPAGNFYDQMIAAPLIPQFADAIKEALPEISAATLEGINFTFLGIDLGITPTWKFFDASVWKWDWAHIGGALLPVLSAAGQLLSIFISQKMNNSLVTNEKGIQDKKTAEESQQAQTSKMMMWVGPIMSLMIGYGIPGALSLYWFVQGLVTTVSDVYLTRKYRKIYDAEDAERLAKHMEEEAIEAEKERVRAERRAANPEGITANTSKKKMQQAKQKEQEAAKAAAAKEYAVKKGIAPEEEEKKEDSALSGIPSRPYCKGRAYDPNRYNDNKE